MLSPHPDDAALSCGAAIAEAVRAGIEVTVLSCFDAAAPPPFSALAGELHHLWGDSRDPGAQRHAEDERSAAALGASVEAIGLLDAIYRVDADGPDGTRRWRYPTPEALFGPVDPADFPLADAVVEAVEARLDDGRRAAVLCPLGIGAHVDHVLTARAGRVLADRGRPVVWYEEMPYAIAGGVSGKGGVAPGVALERKLAAILAHRSQLRMIFGSSDPAVVDRVVRSWPERLGRLAEAHRNTVR